MGYRSRTKWLAVAFLILFPALAGAASVNVVLPSIKGRTGAEIKIPIMVQNPNKLAAFEAFVLYDTAGLETVSDKPAEQSDLTQNFNFEGPVIAPGRLRIRMAQADAVKGPGTLFTITFRIKNEQALKPLRLEGARAIDEDLKDLDVVVITETSGMNSDVTPYIYALINLLFSVGVFLILFRIARLVDCVI